ncbi:MAG: serine/threonine-protein kinase [Pseudomonadota bacterium]
MDKNEKQALNLFEQLLETDPEMRERNLNQWAKPGSAIHQRVQALLAAEARSTGFLEPMVEAERQGRVGPYEIVETLDEGGMGEVFIARRADDAYEQTVAVKLIRSDLWRLPADQANELHERFLRERQILAQLNHPNIARVLDGGETESGQPFLVMELLDGDPLDRWTKNTGPELETLLDVFCQICSAVHEAHQHLIVHRDIKPANIMIGAAGTPKLLDFGIAKRLAPDDPSATATQSGAWTPAYASPEQVRCEPVTTVSDIYSLGVLLYEMVSGIRPYKLSGVSAADAEKMICELEPALPSATVGESSLPARRRDRRRRRLKGDLDNIIMMAMHKDPARRFQSASQLHDDIQRYLANEPVLAYGDSTLYRVTKFVGRHSGKVAATSFFLVALVATTFYALNQSRQAQAAAELADSVNRFLMDTLAETDPYESGREPTIGEVLQAAEKKLTGRFEDQPVLEAEIRYALGFSALSRHELDTAERQLMSALTLRHEHLGQDHPAAAETLAALAWLKGERGDTEPASRLYDDALSRLERGGHTATVVYVRALNDYAVLRLNQEQGDSAAELLQKAQRAAIGAREAVPPPLSLSLKENLAYARELQGRGDEARALYEEALADARAMFPDPHPTLAIHLNNVGTLYFGAGETDQGLAMVEASLAMRREVFVGDHPDIWRASRNLSAMYLEADQPGRALKTGLEALEMARRLYPAGHLHLGVSLLTLAEAYMGVGDNLAALPLLNEAELVLSQSPGDQSYWLAQVEGLREQARPGDSSER